jgi:hypothetical protein
MTFGYRILVLVLAAVAGGCGRGPSTPAEKTANAFMEAYYVRADLPAASKLADGLALSKIAGSEALREGLSVDAAAHQPKVSFDLAGSRAGGEEAEYVYAIEFRPEKSAVVRKTTRLKVRLRDGQWKVTQFTDHED